MLAVAEGAGILSHRLGDEYEPPVDGEIAVAEISYSTNHNYFIELKDDYDRIIEKQTIFIDTLYVGIADRDSIIDLQDYTISAQDTIIKKKKKQVVKSVAVALLATIIAVVK